MLILSWKRNLCSNRLYDPDTVLNTVDCRSAKAQTNSIVSRILEVGYYKRVLAQD